MARSRLVVGLVVVLIAVLLFVFGDESYSTAGGVAFLVLGIVAIALSRRKPPVAP